MPSPYLLIGRALKAWGLEGEVKIEVYADSMQIVEGLGEIQIGPVGGAFACYPVERVRPAASGWVMKLGGVNSPEEAARLVGSELRIPRSVAPPLPEGTFYHADLIGLRVVTQEGRDLGRIVEILETGANDVCVVRGQQGEWLLPATREVVRRVDLAGEIMEVHLLEGMIEAEAV